MNLQRILDSLEYIFQNMDDALCVTDKNGSLLYANPAAETLFGIETDRQKKIWDSIPYIEGNDELIQLFIDAVTEKARNVRSLVPYVNNEGVRFDLHVSMTCESREDGTILIVISDLTKLIRVHSAFVRYTSPEIAEYVLTAPDGEKQGGQTRDVSILMSDLRGFTAMSTQVPSADLILMLNRYFEQMSSVIQENRGTVIEFLGDGIFVVFGAPEDLPDHATAAVRCAVGMQNAMTEVNEWNRSQGYPELSMGIAIHSGPAVVGNIGSDTKMKYGCMGETVNMTGRLESLSVGGQILISRDTKDRIREELAVAGEQSFRPKGGKEDLTVYEITGLGTDHVLSGMPGEIRWISLPRNRKVSFFTLNNKTVDPDRKTGHLTRISEDERYGILVSVAPLETMQNLMLEIGEHEVYAKVLKSDGAVYRLCFTSKPPDLTGLLTDQKPE